MPTTNNEDVYIIPSFDGGQQSKTSIFLNKKNELALAKNVDLDHIVGAISKTLGYSQKGNEIAVARTLLGCGALNTSGGTDKLLAFANTVGDAAADAYIYNSSTEVWDAQSRSFTASQSFETESFLNQLFVVNGLTDVPENYTGAAWSQATNVTDMPKAKFIKEDQFRLFLFNINIPVGGNFPSRVWYCDLPSNNAITWGFESGTDLVTTASSPIVTSAGGKFISRNVKVGDPFLITTDADAGEYEVESINSETQVTLTEDLTATDTGVSFWTGGNWFDVSRDNSDVGKGIGKNSGRLLLFKRFSLYKFLKTASASTDSLILVKGVPGTVSHRSITNLNKWTFYAADSGIWRYDGSNAILISRAVQEVWDGVSTANYGSIVGWNENEELLKIFVGDVSNTDTDLSISKCVMVYNPFTNIWWFESLADTPKCQVTWVQSDVKKHFMFSNGKALQTANGNDFDGEAIDMEAETSWHFPIAPEVSVNITRIKVYTIRGREIDCQYKFAYYFQGEGFLQDEEWKRLDAENKSEYEANYIPEQNDNRACGIKLNFRESSTGVRSAILRVVVYHANKELR